MGQPLPRKRGPRGPKRRRFEPRRTSRRRHPRRMRPEATRARKPEATRARKPEATRVTEVMPLRAAVSAANWAANWGWVITATKPTGMRPTDRLYRKRGAQLHVPPRLGTVLGMGGLGTCCA